jgi:hypothetical protein
MAWELGLVTAWEEDRGVGWQWDRVMDEAVAWASVGVPVPATAQEKVQVMAWLAARDSGAVPVGARHKAVPAGVLSIRMRMESAIGFSLFVTETVA